MITAAGTFGTKGAQVAAAGVRSSDVRVIVVLIDTLGVAGSG